MASLSVPVLFVALTAALPGPLALPAFGFITFGIGMLVAMCAYLRQVVPAAARERLLDVAGMLVLIGSVAFIMTDKAGAFAELGMNYVGSGQNAK